MNAAAKRRFSIANSTAPTAEPGGAPAPQGVPTTAPEDPQPEKAPPKAATYDQRIPLTTDAAMKRALEQARVEDGVTATYRVRAMIELWQEDERIRARVDRKARANRDRDRRLRNRG
jgi:hypothetical protein